MKIRISDVARAAGVSVATVSRVINGQHQFMSEDTRRRVEEVIRQTGYVPNSLAQSLKAQRTRTIGILISNLAHPFWAAVLDEVERTCQERGYNVVFCNSRDDPELERRYLTMLQKRRVDGIVVNPTGKDVHKFFPLIERRFPLITLDRKLESLGIRWVGVNNVYAAALATEHLISLGHRRIGIVLYTPNGLSVREERLRGYQEALLHAGITYDHRLVVFVDPAREDGRDVTRRLFDVTPRPTAIFSTNIRINIEVLLALKDLGLRVPEDISVVGFDDADWMELLDPPLTTVRTPAREMGREAASCIIDAVEGALGAEADGDKASVELMPQLVIRRSARRV